MRKLGVALALSVSVVRVASAQPAAPAPPPPAPAGPAAPATPPAPPAPPAPLPPLAPPAAPAPPAAASASAAPAGSASSDTASESQPQLDFFEPAQAFALPPPPPPPSPSVLLSAFFRMYGFVSGSVDGGLPHVGATVGGSGAAFMLGFLPSEGWLSAGVELPRFRGAALSSSGAMKIGLLGPTFETHVFTDFGDNVQMNLGASLLGLGVSSCSLGKSGLAFFAQLRAPMVHAWLPLVIDGESDLDRTRATPYLSIGGGLEAGLVFF